MEEKVVWYRKLSLNGIKLLFMLLFSYSAIMKLIDMKGFNNKLGESFLPAMLVNWFIWIIPCVELLAVVLLISKRMLIKGLQVSFALMTIFTVYVALLAIIPSDVPCSCGGFLDHIPKTIHVVINALLAVLAFAGIKFERQLNYQTRI